MQAGGPEREELDGDADAAVERRLRELLERFWYPPRPGADDAPPTDPPTPSTPP